MAFIRGKWVEVDRERLSRTLEHFEAVERRAAADGLSFGEAMRLLAGAGIAEDGAAAPGRRRLEPDRRRSVAGARRWRRLRGPDGLARVDPGRSLHGTLRPYQQAGVQWLHLLTPARARRLSRRRHGARQDHPGPVAAAGAEEQAGGEAQAEPAGRAGLAARQLGGGDRPLCAEPEGGRGPSVGAAGREAEDRTAADDLADVDLVITSYGYLARAPWLDAASWRLAMLDEAQAIKNPGRQADQAGQAAAADARIALTGTPIENRLGDLWSIFDFINPGLLGSSKQFSSFVKGLAERPQNPYGPLRDLVRPYILRRLKTDKSIIADLPDKTEVKAFCPLSRKQAALYQQAVDDLAGHARGRRGHRSAEGIVLAFLMRLKQICNHPSQWLGDGAWAEEDSGKFARLREIAEVDRRAAGEGAGLHPVPGDDGAAGGIPRLRVRAAGPRPARRDAGQASARTWCGSSRRTRTSPSSCSRSRPGGAGLNLTAASHVIHFDRWWNPAVENQATDRAFRIGQNKNVLVHKFICRGTVEDKIDQMIESKKQLAGDFLGGGADMLLTEMKDDELLKLVALDLAAAMKEADR